MSAQVGTTATRSRRPATLLTATRKNPFAAGTIGHFLRGHPFQVRNLDRSEKVLSHQKNPKSRLAQKLVGLTTLVLLAVSFLPQPAAGGQKSASEVAKSKEASGLLPVKEALTNAVATYFEEGLDGTKTNKFFEGWTDSDWESFLNKNFGFYAGASKLEAGEPGLELYKKHSNQITGAIAETFHWVQWRKKIEQIAKYEKYTEVEFIDEKTLSKVFGNNGGRRCDGLAIAKKSGNPPTREILGVFESKVSARRVKPIQIENFLVRIQDHYRNQDVSLIRLNDGQTKLIEKINDYDAEDITKAAKSFHKEAARFLTEKDSIHFLLTKVSLEFAGNVMGQTPEQKEKLFDESLPLKELAEFIKKNKRFPRHDVGSQREDKLASWAYKYFEEYEEEIKAYLRGLGGIDEATLDWALKVKADLWKEPLPDLAKFISKYRRFPGQGKDASLAEIKLTNWMASHFESEKKPAILDYLKEHVDESALQLAQEARKPTPKWQDQLPDLAKFVSKYGRFPRQGGIHDGEKKLADWVRRYIESEKNPEILTYLEEHVEEAVLKKALEDFEKRKRGPRGSKIPATDANPDLGECDEELKGILSGLTSAA